MSLRFQPKYRILHTFCRIDRAEYTRFYGTIETALQTYGRAVVQGLQRSTMAGVAAENKMLVIK